ncbi:MAG: PilN domain-containing protein [Phycisphaerae bacterium]|nr:PilN domain-containing protein [Phycisphaerae bacterium]
MSTINLLPENYLQRRFQSRANVICLILFVVVIAGVIYTTAVSKRSIARTLAIRDRVNASYTEAAKLISQMHKLEAQKVEMLRKAELTASLVERVPRSTLLAVVTNALPDGTSLQTLGLQTQRIIRRAEPAEGGKQTGSKLKTKPRKPPSASDHTTVFLEITGLAATDIQVARFIANLARNPLTDSVDLVYSEQKKVKDVTVREFQIKTVLKGEVDAIEFVRPADTDRREGQAHVPDGEML